MSGGTKFVDAEAADPARVGSAAGPASPALARRMTRLRSSAIRDLLAPTEDPEIISLAGGLPAPDTFPADDLRDEAVRLLTDDPQAALQYSTTEGWGPLREWVAGRHGAMAGQQCRAANALITHGSQQALDLLAKVFLDPGDLVAIDDPGYLGAIQAFEGHEPTFLPVSVDADGLDTEQLAEALASGARPKLCYTVPNFGNPTGTTLSSARRRHLAGLADQYGFIVVDDDPYGALRFRGEALPPIAAFTDRAVSLGSFSKIIAPGLRIGWMVAPDWLVTPLVRAKQATDLHTSTLSQRLVAGLVTRPGWLDSHLLATVRVYAERCEALSGALGSTTGARMTLNKPSGGMFLWGRLTSEGANADALFSAALRRRVAFVPGGAFAVAGGSADCLRLSFATADSATLGEAARRLAAAMQDLEGTAQSGRGDGRTDSATPLRTVGKLETA